MNATFIFVTCFIAFISYSIWNTAGIFYVRTCNCNKNVNCIKSFFHSQPDVDFILLLSTVPKPISTYEFSFIEKWSNIDYNKSFTREVLIKIPKQVCKNGSLFLHIFLTPTSNKLWTDLLQNTLAYSVFPLISYQLPQAKSFKLLDSSSEKETNEDKFQNMPVTHIFKEVHVRMMTELFCLKRNDLPEDLFHFVRFSKKYYYPLLVNDILHSRLQHLKELPKICNQENIILYYEPISLGKLRLFLQFEASLRTLRGYGFKDKDIDEVKGIFADTNFYLLCVTMLVSSLHILFDLLAFKNDIVFWKHKENRVGLSARTMLWRAFSQLVVFFFLVDEKTSLLVLIPAGIGSIIELWKITKAFKISFCMQSWYPCVKFGIVMKEEEQTEEFDIQSMKFLSYILYPLCILGGIYSLLYIPHRSWYSWCLNTLVNGIYAFGFLFMLPQLFVNYKLKSVAHLPWKAFMYKALNTFIDDIFAFIITMPTIHRVACFRDDIVFVIYLYQRWLYPVDHTRINEYGETSDMARTKKDL